MKTVLSPRTASIVGLCIAAVVVGRFEVESPPDSSTPVAVSFMATGLLVVLPLTLPWILLLYEEWGSLVRSLVVVELVFYSVVVIYELCLIRSLPAAMSASEGFIGLYLYCISFVSVVGVLILGRLGRRSATRKLGQRD